MAQDFEFSTRKTRQTEQARQDQVRNHAGGYVFSVNAEERFWRFLLLGAESTYYASAREMTTENARNMVNVANSAPDMFVKMVYDASNGRAYKNDAPLFALAYGLSNAKTRDGASKIFNDVVRIGTHLFTAAHYMQKFRGWGRVARRVFSDWYLSQPNSRLAYQIIKYQGRTVIEGKPGTRWTHRDVLRKAHPRTSDPVKNALLHYAAKGELPDVNIDSEALAFVRAYERMKSAQTVGKVIDIISRYKFTWEMVPGQWRKYPDVWRALLPHMPVTALLRNLGNLASAGLLKPFSTETAQVAARISDGKALAARRVHPIAVLLAAKVYGQGHGKRSNNTWIVAEEIKDALNKAFVEAFQSVEPTGKAFLVAVDVSASMDWPENYTAGGLLTSREAAAAIAYTIAKTEKRVHVMAFSHGVQEFPIGKGDSLSNVIGNMRSMWAGSTDCALPMMYALEHELMVDEFVVLTDNETWYGTIHPYQALRMYRERINPKAKLVVAAMTPTNFSIADPNDVGSLDIVGFDAAVPRLVQEFAAW